jgi:uncharacterized protein involved in exopolysaccharide biosynthesis
MTDQPNHAELTSDEVQYPVDQNEITLRDLLIILLDRKKLIAYCVVGGLAVGLALAFGLPSKFAATAVLMPPQSGSSLASAKLAQLSNMSALVGGQLGVKNQNDMYVSMLKSVSVENALIQKYSLAAEYREKTMTDTRVALERNVVINGDGKDGLISISVTDRNPQRSAELANGYVSIFQEYLGRLAISEAAQRSLFYEKQLDQSKTRLAEAEDAFRNVEAKTGIVSVDMQTRASVEAAASLQAQIAAQEVAIQSMRNFATENNAQLQQAEQVEHGLQDQLAKLAGSQTQESGLIVPKGALPQSSLEYARKFRDLKFSETLYEAIARQYEFAKIDQAHEGDMFQVVDPATVPEKRSSPKRAKVLLECLGAGLILGILFALLLAWLQYLTVTGYFRGLRR